MWTGWMGREAEGRPEFAGAATEGGLGEVGEFFPGGKAVAGGEDFVVGELNAVEEAGLGEAVDVGVEVLGEADRFGFEVVAYFLAGEDILELVPAGVSEQESGVVARDERREAHRAMAAGGKVVEKGLADLVNGHDGEFSVFPRVGGTGRHTPGESIRSTARGERGFADSWGVASAEIGFVLSIAVEAEFGVFALEEFDGRERHDPVDDVF